MIKVDAGEVVCKREIPFIKGDTLETLEARLHEVEHVIIVEGVRLMLSKISESDA
jgi:phosphoribosylglycinamide formyltransferase